MQAKHGTVGDEEFLGAASAAWTWSAALTIAGPAAAWPMAVVIALMMVLGRPRPFDAESEVGLGRAEVAIGAVAVGLVSTVGNRVPRCVAVVRPKLRRVGRARPRIVAGGRSVRIAAS
jgi:hypothetical protein